MLEESSPAAVPATAVHWHTGAASREGATYPSAAGLDPEGLPRQRSCLGTAESLPARPLGGVAIPSRRKHDLVREPRKTPLHARFDKRVDIRDAWHSQCLAPWPVG